MKGVPFIKRANSSEVNIFISFLSIILHNPHFISSAAITWELLKNSIRLDIYKSRFSLVTGILAPSGISSWVIIWFCSFFCSILKNRDSSESWSSSFFNSFKEWYKGLSINTISSSTAFSSRIILYTNLLRQQLTVKFSSNALPNICPMK